MVLISFTFLVLFFFFFPIQIVHSNVASRYKTALGHKSNPLEHTLNQLSRELGVNGGTTQKQRPKAAPRCRKKPKCLAAPTFWASSDQCSSMTATHLQL